MDKGNRQGDGSLSIQCFFMSCARRQVMTFFCLIAKVSQLGVQGGCAKTAHRLTSAIDLKQNLLSIPKKNSYAE